MNFLKSLFRTRPMQWSPVETFLMRLLFAAALFFFASNWDLQQVTELEKPNGIARFLPLKWMTIPGVIVTLKWLTAASLLVYVAGFFPALSLTIPVLAICGLGAVRNSMGDITHVTQLGAMVLLGQWLVYLFAAIRSKDWKKVAARVHSTAVFASILVIGGAYVASGIVKLKESKGAWIGRVPWLSIHVIKANQNEDYSKLEHKIPAVADFPLTRPVPMSVFWSEVKPRLGKDITADQFKAHIAPRMIVDNPNLARVFFGTGLVLEILGFILVMGRRHAFWFAAALIAMHVGISLLMEIEFWNHMALLGIFCVLPGVLRLIGLGPKSDAVQPAPAV